MKNREIWDKKRYSDEFLREFKATAKVRMDGDLPVIEKYAPDARSKIAIDPRLLDGMLSGNVKKMLLIPDFILDKVKIKMSDKALAKFRENCGQITSAVCVKYGIDIDDTFVAAQDGYPIPIRIYRSEKCMPGCGCLYFMHGGGFVGGSILPYDEGWKVFVEKFHMVVVSVDYRLMPENPYPTLYEDCYCVLEWIYNNADLLHIDRTHIFVTGDSAGGNLAQYCSTRAKGTDMVRGQLLIYAVLNMFGVEDEYYRPDRKNFVYEPGQKKLSRCITRQLELLVKSFQNEDIFGITEPDFCCNPYTYDAGGNPPTFIAVGALDFLKNDNIAWAHKLHDAGVPVKVVVYNGMGHGFFNSMGVFPQAEDMVDEIGQFIREYS